MDMDLVVLIDIIGFALFAALILVIALRAGGIR